MITLAQIEAEIMAALKAKDQLLADTLRGLKLRVQNEQIAKMPAKGGSASGGKELSEDEILALVKSEIKRRKEAAEAYVAGNRQELADKELAEAKILEKYLPPQKSEAELGAIIDQAIAEAHASPSDFGKLMGKLKSQLGSQADGATLARLLKEKLK
jgi:hypothetical protein